MQEGGGRGRGHWGQLATAGRPRTAEGGRRLDCHDARGVAVEGEGGRLREEVVAADLVDIGGGASSVGPAEKVEDARGIAGEVSDSRRARLRRVRAPSARLQIEEMHLDQRRTIGAEAAVYE